MTDMISVIYQRYISHISVIFNDNVQMSIKSKRKYVYMYIGIYWHIWSKSEKVAAGPVPLHHHPWSFFGANNIIITIITIMITMANIT